MHNSRLLTLRSACLEVHNRLKLSLQKKRKLLIICLFYIDLFVHGLLAFGWSSIDQIMKHEGFFESSTSNSTQAQTSGRIFVQSIASRGVLLLIFAFIRDFVSLGLARLATFSALILSYLLLRC